MLENARMKQNAGDGTASLEKALDILEAVGAAPQGLSQTELAARLAMPRTTLYRLLATLVARGMLRRDPSRRVYGLGPLCFEMARSAYAVPDLSAAATMELRALRDLTGETSYLAALDGIEMLSLERCDGAHSQRSHSALGQRKPLHCTSQGKAVLSVLDDATRDQLLRDISLKAVTPRSITDRLRLLSELKITAARGWSVDDEEIVLGVRCVGAPIVDSAGKVRGAISVAGPAFRMTMERVQGLGPEVADAARRIGAQLPSSPSLSVPAVAKAVPGPWAFRGEFARWSDARRCLFWADSLAPSVRVFDGEQDRELARFDAPLIGLVLNDEGLLVACAAGFWQLALPAAQGGGALGGASGGASGGATGADTGAAGAAGAVGPRLVLPSLHPWPGATPTALCSAPDGELWTCAPQAAGRWSVAAVSRDALGQDKRESPEPSPQWTNTEPLAAMAWDASGQFLYGLAPESGVILVMQRGHAAVRRLATVPKGSGRLSGLAVDAGGGVWTALQDGWSVVRFAPDGNQDRVIGLPVPCPSDVAPAQGKGPARLFVTSARQAVSMEALGSAPLSGRLFCIDLPL